MKTLLNSIARDYGSLPRPVYILFAGGFINRFGHFVLPFLALYLSQQGYAESTIAIVLAAHGAGALVGALLGGYLADTIGRRNTMVTSLASKAVLIIALFIADSSFALMSMAFLVGLAGFLYPAAANALIADMTSPEQRTPAFVGARIAVNAGWALGPACAGWLIMISPFLLFAGDAISSFIFAMLVLAYLPHGLRERAPAGNPFKVAWGRLQSAGQDMRTNREFRRFIGAQFLTVIVVMQLFAPLALIVKDNGLSDTDYGMLLGLNGMMILLIELPLSQYTRRLPPKLAITIGYGLIAIAMGGIAFAHSFAAFIALKALFTLGEMISFPISSVYVNTLAPDHMRGRYLGVVMLSWAAGGMVGPAAGIFLYEFFGQSYLLAAPLCGAISLGMLWGFGLGRKKIIATEVLEPEVT